MKRKYNLFIQDITDAIRAINAFLDGLSEDDFLESDLLQSAVMRKIEIIGEAAKLIPPDIRERYPSIPWSRMAKIRDKIIHGYFGINISIIWLTAKDNLPKSLPELDRILAESDE